MNVLRAAMRLYVLALRAFPRRLRATYSAELIDTFARELASYAAQRGVWRALRFALAATINVVNAGIGERRRLALGSFTARTGFSTLDVVLAWRMLARYPGLSVVGVLGMTVGITIATGASAIVSAIMQPMVPLAEGERIVALLNWDASTNNRELRLVHDFDAWRGLQSVEDIGLTRTVERNAIVDGGAPEPVAVAEISATAFRVARVPPALGRYLLSQDERPGAPDVIVIGYDEWLRRFGGDPGIIGRSFQLGSRAYEIVGVMPQGFAFPVNHSFWIPWRVDSSAFLPRTGPDVTVFARLAPGASLESAQSELALVGRRMTAQFPGTHEHLRPRVVPYTFAFNDMDDPDNALALRAIQLALVLLLVIVCVNVAILVYARTVTRQAEIAVRGALGASRRRIVAQLFVEALLLAGIAAILGVGLVSLGLAQITSTIVPVAGPLPFWMRFELTTGEVAYVALLAFVSAAIVGIVPALKVTGFHVHRQLQSLSAGGGSRMQMGRFWTGLIVAQVAFAVALLPATIFYAWQGLRLQPGTPAFATGELLTTVLVLDRASAAPPTAEGERDFRARYALAYAEIARRVRAQAGVRDVTFSMESPGGERALVAEVEGQAPPPEPVDYNIVEGTKRGHLVRFNRVAANFFDVIDVPLVAGRGFTSGDRSNDSARGPGVVVNRTMAIALFTGSNPLGQRIRYVGRSREAAARDVELDRWYEIIGVVADVPATDSLGAQPVDRVYHVAAPGEVYPARVAVRVRSTDPWAFADTLRTIAASVDANLQLADLSTANQVFEREQSLMRMLSAVLVAVMLSVVLLSAAGIYALMSFTVARRRREIGIRAALGADRNRILAGVFSRAFAQLALGAAIGMLGAIGLEQLLEGDTFRGQGALILPLAALVMTTVGIVAAIEPARQGLRIDPTEALRDE